MIGLVLFLLAQTAEPPPAHHPPCWLVRSYLELYGEKAAHDTAIKHGYTEVEIAATRARCKVKS